MKHETADETKTIDQLFKRYIEIHLFAATQEIPENFIDSNIELHELSQTLYHKPIEERIIMERSLYTRYLEEKKDVTMRPVYADIRNHFHRYVW